MFINSLITIILVLVEPLILVSQEPEQHCSDYLYGLYYGSWDNQDSDLAFVISPNGQPIPSKVNDPEAPTEPGFYVGDKHFDFASSKFSTQGFSFRTKAVNGITFTFHGKFGCEQVDIIPEVPYLAGELQETRNGHLVRKAKLHFVHAVIF